MHVPVQAKYLCVGMKEHLAKFCDPLVSKQPLGFAPFHSASEHNTKDTVLSLHRECPGQRPHEDCGHQGTPFDGSGGLCAGARVERRTSSLSDWGRELVQPKLIQEYIEHLLGASRNTPGKWGFYEGLNFQYEFVGLDCKWDTRINVDIAKTWGHKSCKILANTRLQRGKCKYTKEWFGILLKFYLLMFPSMHVLSAQLDGKPHRAGASSCCFFRLHIYVLNWFVRILGPLKTLWSIFTR